MIPLVSNTRDTMTECRTRGQCLILARVLTLTGKSFAALRMLISFFFFSPRRSSRMVSDLDRLQTARARQQQNLVHSDRSVPASARDCLAAGRAGGSRAGVYSARVSSSACQAASGGLGQRRLCGERCLKAGEEAGAPGFRAPKILQFSNARATVAPLHRCNSALKNCRMRRGPAKPTAGRTRAISAPISTRRLP